ncbi:class I SAM-dependent methyltransferase [Thalassospira lucentensis]|uniref:class I SAM-dependent methyltransferase n=1 Tax=Thalassospira lucentensis TaxID=168935 RepID=UPI00399D66F4
MSKKNSLQKNKFGYLEIVPKPQISELKMHYQDKYYQQNRSVYEQSYSEDELLYFENEAELCYGTLRKHRAVDKKLLDVGCGEGFLAKYFLDRGWDVRCVDFSNYGITRHNPALLPHFQQGDLLEYIDEQAANDCRYSFVNLDNVLEHVLDPEALLEALKKIMDEKSVARIEVPNDFSSFQQLVVDLDCTEQTWISPPEHLSYFNKDSLKSLLNGMGFKIVSLQADFPIELFLLNENSNYWRDRGLGKAAHKARVICSNYLAGQSISSYIDYREAAAELEFGRILTAYVVLDDV